MSMEESERRIIDLTPRLRQHRTLDDVDIENERIRNLAFQATKLPTTLSRREIEDLGMAILLYMRRHSRIV